MKMDKFNGNERLPADILTDKQLHYVASQVAQPGFQITDYHLRPASEEGIAGFVGDHFKMSLNVQEKDSVRTIHLFMKTLPITNEPKANIIVEGKMFQREDLMYKLLEEMQGDDTEQPWYIKSYFHNDRIIILPDLSVQGYETHSNEKYFGRSHAFVTMSSVARFHAASANYFTEKYINTNHTYNFLSEYGSIITDPTFCECPWLRAAAKLTSDFLIEFSSNSKQFPADLEERIWRLFLKACNSLRESEDTLNVVLHKDLWANNIFFQYKDEVPVNAVLLDFQCIRYAPPAFDLMSFLYLTTSRGFRNSYEDEILQYYYSTFLKNLNDLTKRRLQDLNYDEEEFLAWCQKARLFGMVHAIAIFPFILMPPAKAQTLFDDPDTYLEYLNKDRSLPVIAYARDNDEYRNRQLEICEEFFEKFVR